MAKLQLGTREGRTKFKPGDEIAGAVLWELPTVPDWVELRLLWSTRGKGTEDSMVVHTERFELPTAGDTRTYSFRAPIAPYSFSGKLISLIWALELVAKPGKLLERLEITMAPGEREIELPECTPLPGEETWWERRKATKAGAGAR